MAKKIYKFVRIGLFKEQSEIVDKIQNDKGEQLSGVIRQLLNEYGEKHFPQEPDYVRIQRERLDFKKRSVEEEKSFKQLSPEEYALSVLGARIVRGAAWFCTQSTFPYPVDLKFIKDMTEDDDLVKIHQKILNLEEVFSAGGKVPMSKDSMKKAIRNWKDQK